MICPKCGFEQPDSLECARCGIFVSRYKGPALVEPVPPPPPPPWMTEPARPAPSVAVPPAATAAAPPAEPRHRPAAPAGTVYGGEAAPPSAGSLYGDPAPAGTVHGGPSAGGGGTVYGGPPASGGGTVYAGPAAGAPPRRPGSGAAALGVLQKLAMGETLSQSLAIFFRNLIPFLILTAIAFSPIYLFGDYLLRRAALTNVQAVAAYGSLVGLATVLICIPLTTGMITYGVFQEMRGKSLSLGSCLSVGLSSLPSVMSVAFLQLLFFVGALLLLVPISAFLVGLGGRGCGILFLPLLLLAMLFPFTLWIRFFVAVPAAVEERPGALEALRRSAFLTDGQRWRIFGVILVVGVLQLAVQLGTVAVPVAGPFLQPLGSLVTTALLATTCAVIYYRLRSFHESIDVDQISSVFD